MISSAFIYLASYIIGFFVVLFPASTGFPSDITNAFTTMGGYVQVLNTILPITTLASVLVILFATDIIIFGFKTMKWLVSYLPFIGGRG